MTRVVMTGRRIKISAMFMDGRSSWCLQSFFDLDLVPGTS